MSKGWVLGAGLMLAGCASQAPVHFYSLYAPDAVVAPRPLAASAAHAGTAGGQPGLRVELGQVSVPERLNRPNIVVHPAEQGAPSRARGEGAQPLQILEYHRLDAVFGDAFRDALSTQIATLTPGHEAGTSGSPPPLLRLDLKVHRFDGARDGGFDALIDWRVRQLGEASEQAYAGLGCRFQRHDQTRPDDVAALVASMQQQVRALAVEVVEGSRQWLATGKAECPSQMMQQPAEHRLPVVPAEPAQDGRRS